MGVISKKKVRGIDVYIVDKTVPDAKMAELSNTFITPHQIAMILTESADVYTDTGALLLRFRKRVLPKTHADLCYDNIVDFAMRKGTNRGNATGSASKSRNNRTNPPTMSNIFGFFDRFSPRQKFIFANQTKKKIFEARACNFNVDFPDKYARTLPYIQDIDRQYKKQLPAYYAKQRRKCDQTHFKIPNTSFTTVTTNVNFQTTIHKDRGDDAEGFGNLSVISRGTYSGAETCFPQYGIGVDVRPLDILFMDVHEWHGNLPIKAAADAKRISLVCYLRTNLWKKTKGKSRAFMEAHLKLLNGFRASTQKRELQQQQAKKNPRKTKQNPRKTKQNPRKTKRNPRKPNRT